MQFTGPIAKITAVGLICMMLCGGSVKITLKDGFELSSDGITKVIDTIVRSGLKQINRLNHQKEYWMADLFLV